MATRFYLPSSGTAPASPAYDTSWDDTGFGARLPCYTTKQGSTMTTLQDNDLGTGNTDHLFRQWVSEPLEAQTIQAQTIKLQMRALEAAAKNDAVLSISVRVCYGDGSGFRGTLLSLTRDDTELDTALENRQFSATCSQVVTSAGDRIVIEIGVGGVPWGNGDHNNSISIGDDNATDLGENDTDTAAYNPWVEFATDTITFGAEPIIVTPAAASAVAASVAPTVVKGSTTATPAAASTIASSVNPTVLAGVLQDYLVTANALLMTTDGYVGTFSGPFCDSNGNLYVILIDDTSEYQLECWKSTDGGQNWYEQDSTNKPTTDGSSAIAGFGAQQIGDTIYIATLTDGGTVNIDYHTFQTSDHTSGSDSWGTTDEQVYDVYTDTSGEFGCAIVAQPDGDIIIVTAADQVSTFEQVRYHYDIGSGWVTHQPLLTGSYDSVVGGMNPATLDGNDDSIWIVAKEESGRDYVLWNLADPDSSSGSGTSIFTNFTVTDRNYASTNLCFYDDGGVSKLVIVTPDSSFTPWCQVITSGSVPDAFQVTTDVLYDYSAGPAHRPGHGLAVDGTTIYYVYSNNSDGDIYLRTSENGASFGNADSLVSNTTAPIISVNIYVRDGYNRLGVLWENTLNGDVRFVEKPLSAAGASPLVITPTAASTVVSTANPTVVFGDTTTTPAAASAVGSTTNPTVVKGPLSITPAPASAVASSVDPTTVYGSITIVPAASSAVVSTVDPGVVQTSQTVTPAAASAVVSTANPDVVYGSLSIQPDASYAVVSTVAPSVVYGSLTISPAASSAIASTVTPTVVYGSVSIAPAASYAVVSTIDPTVSVGALIISPAAASAVVSTVDPTVEYGSLSITPVVAESIVSTVDPTVVQESLSITPDVSYAVVSTVAPAVVYGSLTIAPSVVSAVASTVNPDVVYGSLDITPTAAQAVADVVAPSTQLGSTTATSTPAYAVASTTDPTVSAGALVVAPSPASTVVSTVDPTVVQSSTTVTPVASSAVVSAVDPTVVYGDITVSNAIASAVVSTVNPTVVYSSVTITPTASYAVASTVNPTTIYGSVTVAPDASYAVVSTVDPTVVGGEEVVITPTPAYAVVSTVDPSVIYGNVTISPAPASAVVSTVDPTVSEGALVIQPTPAYAVCSTVDPTTIYGSVSIVPTASYAIVSTTDPIVGFGSTTATPAPASAIVSTTNPGIIYGSLTLSPSPSYAVVSSVNPTVVYGSVVCTDVASCVVSTIDPTIVYGSVTITVASVYTVARTVNPIVITGLIWRPIKRFEVAINTEYVTTNSIYESIEFEVELTEILENEVSL